MINKQGTHENDLTLDLGFVKLLTLSKVLAKKMKKCDFEHVRSSKHARSYTKEVNDVR